MDLLFDTVCTARTAPLWEASHGGWRGPESWRAPAGPPTNHAHPQGLPCDGAAGTAGWLCTSGACCALATHVRRRVSDSGTYTYLVTLCQGGGASPPALSALSGLCGSSPFLRMSSLLVALPRFSFLCPKSLPCALALSQSTHTRLNHGLLYLQQHISATHHRGSTVNGSTLSGNTSPLHASRVIYTRRAPFDSSPDRVAPARPPPSQQC